MKCIELCKPTGLNFQTTCVWSCFFPVGKNYSYLRNSGAKELHIDNSFSKCGNIEYGLSLHERVWLMRLRFERPYFVPMMGEVSLGT